MIWTETFNGTKEIKEWYASLRDSERILGGAYCRALSSFAQAVAGDAFREKLLQGKVELHDASRDAIDGTPEKPVEEP
jgi:hypothetical protein